MPAQLRRVIVNPVAMVILSLLLANEAWRVSGYTGPVQRSQAGEWIARQLNMPRFAGSGRTSGQVFVVREDVGVVVIDPDRESWDRLSRVMVERPQDVLEVQYTVQLREHGFWMPTQREVRLDMTLTDFGGEFSPQERAAAREAAARAVPAPEVNPGLAPPAQGELVEQSIIWRGIALNVYSLMLLGLLLYSLQWVARVPAWFRALRTRRADARGVCPGCGYVLRGLEDPVCPECGRPS